MIEVSILVPRHGNDGVAFSAALIAAFEDQATDLFGGVSRLDRDVVGTWRNDKGKTFHDVSTEFLVAVDSLLRAAENVLHLVEVAKATFEQEAIYVRYLGQSDIL